MELMHGLITACAHGADVIFVLDSSITVQLSNFQKMTSFVGTVIQALDINSAPDGPTISRVGVVTAGVTATVQFQLNTYQTKAQLLQAVNVPYSADATSNIDAAIR